MTTEQCGVHDLQIQELRADLAEARKDIVSMRHTLYGNGSEGLCEQVRNHGRLVKIAVGLITLVTPLLTTLAVNIFSH